MIYIDETKVRRNSRINCPGSDQRMPSCHSLDNGNYEVIKFDTPDIVFAEIDQSTINIQLENHQYDKKV